MGKNRGRPSRFRASRVRAVVKIAAAKLGEPDIVILDVEMLRMKAGIFKFKASARVGAELACEAELTCAMRKVA